MAGCCGTSAEEDKDISGGPLMEGRGCTDAWCLIVFAVAWVGFIAVSFAGAADGNPSKLYLPRDFRGAYCDAATNWNNGPDTSGKPKLTYFMNVSSTTDMIAKQMLCSTEVSNLLTGTTGLLSTTEQDNYLCACCLSPCASCDGSLSLGGDLTSAANLAEVIQSKMTDLTSGANAASLANPSSINGDMFTNMWAEATKYFTKVCIESCDTNYATLVNMTAADKRNYTYVPAMDNPLKTAWETLLTDPGVPTTITNTISSSFTYEAFPLSMCPYHESKCVPMPGVEFEEIVSGSGYCSFKMAAEATAAVGSTAAAAFEGLGGDALASTFSDGLGEWVGHIIETIDTIIIVAILSFVVGLIFLVLLRFTVGICVWTAVLITVLIFPLGGAMAFVRSGQCSGAGFFDTGVQVGVAVAVAGSTAVTNAISGESVSEAMTGDGADYAGVQKYTMSGKTCAQWSSYYDSNMTETVANVALTENYCRNPYEADDALKARTIWCYTTDSEVRWEVCLPIGVIQPECAHGYAVEGATMRDVLKWTGYVIWVLGIFWIIIVLCFVNKIRLAVALNKVGADFLATNPIVLTVPIVQAIVGVIWICVWCFLAAFLLSQVPDGYVPTEAYESYAEAYGVDGDGFLDSGTPGKCTDSWPTGGVWKDEGNCDVADDGTVKCWRCFPPRYVFDIRFAYSFFCFLWNNAFNIALGQIVIAGAVVTWFFTENEKKGSEPVLRWSLKTVFRFHLGSVAFGSFIIALIQFIRACMKYLEKQAAAQKNRVMQLVFKIVGCCIWCFEKCMKFLNKNAYIQIMLKGTNFCTSAYNAFMLILKNFAIFGTVAALGSIVHSIGVFCIVAGTALLGYFIVRAMHDDIPPFMPMLMFIFIGYVVSQLFMSVFGMAVDTSLQCFIAAKDNPNVPVPPVLTSILPRSKEEARKWKGDGEEEKDNEKDDGQE